MWCPQCQTQVAGIASSREQSGLVCAKCQTRLEAGAESKPSRKAAYGTSQSVVLPGLRFDSSRMQATLSRVDNLVQRLGEPANFEEVGSKSSGNRTSAKPVSLEMLSDAKAENRFPWLAAISLAGGVTLLVCGCLLIVWSVVAKRPELFNLGFPISVISLACMALAACLFFQDASGKQAETQKWIADVQSQLGGIRDIAENSRHSLGSIPELPSSLASSSNDRLSKSEERLNALRRRLKDTRSH